MVYFDGVIIDLFALSTPGLPYHVLALFPNQLHHNYTRESAGGSNDEWVASTNLASRSDLSFSRVSMTFDPFLQGIAEAKAPELVSQDGQELAMLARLLADIHELKPVCLDLLCQVFREFQHTGLQPDQLDGVIVKGDAWRSILARFIDKKYEKFVSFIEKWHKSLPIEQELVFVVLFMLLADDQMQSRTLGLPSMLLTTMQNYYYFARGHNAFVFSVSPVAIMPIYDPLVENRSSFIKRCNEILTRYADQVEKVHTDHGAVSKTRRPSELKHLRAFAYHLTEPKQNWYWVASQPDVLLTESSVIEGCDAVAKRLNLQLDGSRLQKP